MAKEIKSDCTACKNFAEPVLKGRILPKNVTGFCLKKKIFLEKWNYKGMEVTGIAKAYTCPYFKRKKQ